MSYLGPVDYSGRVQLIIMLNNKMTIQARDRVRRHSFVGHVNRWFFLLAMSTGGFFYWPWEQVVFLLAMSTCSFFYRPCEQVVFFIGHVNM